jgi:hypothetical protein
MVRPEGSRTREINPVLLVCSGKPAGVVAEEGFLPICEEPIVIKLVIAFMQPPLSVLTYEGANARILYLSGGHRPGHKKHQYSYKIELIM